MLSTCTTPGSPQFERLIRDCISDMHMPEVAEANDITLTELLEWFSHPDVIRTFDELHDAMRRRAELIHEDARPAAVHTLRAGLNKDPATAYRAAACIIRGHRRPSPPNASRDDSPPPRRVASSPASRDDSPPPRRVVSSPASRLDSPPPRRVASSPASRDDSPPLRRVVSSPASCHDSPASESRVLSSPVRAHDRCQGLQPLDDAPPFAPPGGRTNPVTDHDRALNNSPGQRASDYPDSALNSSSGRQAWRPIGGGSGEAAPPHTDPIFPQQPGRAALAVPDVDCVVMTSCPPAGNPDTDHLHIPRSPPRDVTPS